MSDLADSVRDLYREVILDHSRSPRNFGPLEDANREAEGFNPLCGDRLKLYLSVEDGRVQDARFVGNGCAISTASASLLTEAAKGLPEAEALKLVEEFRRMVSGESIPDEEELGKLMVFAGVRDYPTRVKCATLAWHTLAAAVEQRDETVRTE